jgi:hypothetical protein
MSAPLKPHERQPDALWAGYESIMKTLREKLDRADVADGKHYLPTAAVPASGRLLRDMEAFQVTTSTPTSSAATCTARGNHFFFSCSVGCEVQLTWIRSCGDDD